MSGGAAEGLAATILSDKNDPSRLSYGEMKDSYGTWTNFCHSYGLKPYDMDDLREALEISRSLKCSGEDEDDDEEEDKEESHNTGYAQAGYYEGYHNDSHDEDDYSHRDGGDGRYDTAECYYAGGGLQVEHAGGDGENEEMEEENSERYIRDGQEDEAYGHRDYDTDSDDDVSQAGRVERTGVGHDNEEEDHHSAGAATDGDGDVEENIEESDDGQGEESQGSVGQDDGDNGVDSSVESRGGGDGDCDDDSSGGGGYDSYDDGGYATYDDGDYDCGGGYDSDWWMLYVLRVL